MKKKRRKKKIRKKEEKKKRKWTKKKERRPLFSILDKEVSWGADRKGKCYYYQLELKPTASK